MVAGTIEKKSAGMPTVIDREAILNILHLNPREANVQALILVCEKYGLDPILKHALLVEGRLYVTRDGLLHVAHTSGHLDGIEVIEQSQTNTHHVAKVAVYRNDMTHPFTFVGRYPIMRTKWEGPQNNRRQVEEVHPYGPEMAVKCAEVMGLRRAFDVALAAREELWDMDTEEPVRAASTVVMPSEPMGSGSDEPSGTDSPRADGSVPSSEVTSPAPGDGAGPQEPVGEGLVPADSAKPTEFAGRPISASTADDEPASEELWKEAEAFIGLDRSGIAAMYRDEYGPPKGTPLYARDIKTGKLLDLMHTIRKLRAENEGATV